MADVGQTIMEAASAHLVPGILGDCGGCVSCGTCEAIIDEDWAARLPPRGDDEVDLLHDAQENDPRIRLTCQIQVTDSLDGMVVRLP